MDVMVARGLWWPGAYGRYGGQGLVVPRGLWTLWWPGACGAQGLMDVMVARGLWCPGAYGGQGLMVARGLWWPGAYGGQGLMVARGQGHLAIWNLHVWGNLHESDLQ